MFIETFHRYFIFPHFFLKIKMSMETSPLTMLGMNVGK
jgi:hypothetical protein